MRHLLTKAANGAQVLRHQLDAINATIASSMLGREVSVQSGARNPARGIVAGVLIEGETPRIIVNGTSYDLSQVLAVMPPAFN